MWARTDCSHYAVIKPFPEFVRCRPKNVIELFCIEVCFLKVDLSAGIDNRDPDSARKSSLKIHSVSIASEIGDDEWRESDVSQNLVHNPTVMFDKINAGGAVSRLFNRGLNRFVVSGIHRGYFGIASEPHCHKYGVIGRACTPRNFFEVFPTLGGHFYRPLQWLSAARL